MRTLISKFNLKSSKKKHLRKGNLLIEVMVGMVLITYAVTMNLKTMTNPKAYTNRYKSIDKIHTDNNYVILKSLLPKLAQLAPVHGEVTLTLDQLPYISNKHNLSLNIPPTEMASYFSNYDTKAISTFNTFSEVTVIRTSYSTYKAEITLKTSNFEFDHYHNYIPKSNELLNPLDANTPLLTENETITYTIEGVLN